MRDEFLWCERYRPKTIDDCILPKKTKDYFNDMIKQGEVQNLILVGSPGTGKTTVAKALCNELNVDFLMINASENGNIDTLRTTIRGFASTMSFHSPVKVVILDEADYLNPNSTQPALRNFIEEFSSNCRFIMTANFANRIIDPLKSRCAVVDFAIPKDEKMDIIKQLDKRVKYILEKEEIEFDNKILAQVIMKFYPDFRKIINELQRNTTSGTLTTQALAGFSDDLINHLISLLKDPAKWGEMRRWVGENSDNDFATIARTLYDKSAKFVVPSSIPQLVLIIAEYQFKESFVVDKEINTVAFLTEVMTNIEFIKS